ncbi:MAG: Na-translocating system protein MpsC family protein [Phycisphaerae bacterium]|nr:Na-translocating system protein MpsC family protein [Phycisphaerae bacterium]
MNKQDQLKQQIVEAVSRFQKDQLAVTCESLTVDFHPDNLVVTLSGATCPAEREYAQDRNARELLERFYNELFTVIKPILEGQIQEILGRKVRRSRLSIDPCSGVGVILLALTSKTCPEG